MANTMSDDNSNVVGPDMHGEGVSNVTYGEPYEPPPDALVQAVAMECHPWDWGQMEAALSAVPDDWAKLSGDWVRLARAEDVNGCPRLKIDAEAMLEGKDISAKEG